MADPIRIPLPLGVLLAATLALGLGACSRTAGDPAQKPASPAATADAGAPAVPVDQIAAGAEEPQMSCNADAVQSLVGQQATEALVARATADSGSANVRVLGPRDAATMDFRGDRLNILTDDAGIVQTLSCG